MEHMTSESFQRRVQRSRARQSEVAIALCCLLHPQSLAALALLGVNDHLYKGVGPGWLTGKLSDFAGLFYFPFLLIVLCAPLARRSRGLTLGRAVFWSVAIWFAAAKTIPAVHLATSWLATQLVGDVLIVRDPWDLVALIALLPAWRLYRRAADAPWPARRVLQVPVVCVALLLTAATSRPRSPSVDRLIEHQGTLVAIIYDSPAEAEVFAVYASADGRQWQETQPLPEELVTAHQPRTERQTAAGERLILRGRALFVGRANQEDLVWHIPTGRQEFMQVAGAMSWEMKDIAELPQAPGTFVVALGTEGVLVGGGQRWTRVAVGPVVPTAPSATWGDALSLVLRGQWIFGAAAAFLAAAFLSLLTWLAPAHNPVIEATARPTRPLAATWQWLRRGPAAFARLGIDWACAVAAVVAMLCAGVVFSAFAQPLRLGPDALIPLPWLIAFPLLLALVALLLGWGRYRDRAPQGAPQPGRKRILGAALLGGVLAMAALLAWDVGWLESLGATMSLALLGSLLAPLIVGRGAASASPGAPAAPRQTDSAAAGSPE